MRVLTTFTFLLMTVITNGQTVSKYIIVDQFGYRTNSEKIAVVRDPLTGFDASESFAPGFNYALVDATTDTQVFTGNVVPWNSGNEDDSSGDRAWWFDFSSYQTPGTYYVLDINQNLRSYEFSIADDVYEEVLKHAVRTFFYQRAGYEKNATYAGNDWADSASHLGNLQDTECRKWDSPNDASTEKDLSGGWYDAGDYNKYTHWTANYVFDLLKAYIENPNAWSDDYDLPYSNNGTPDIIDEIIWGMDHLLRLQETNGSMISIVDLDHASPPSSATGQSLYGGVNTTATLSSAGAFALGSKVFEDLGMSAYANTLRQSALNAWNWADTNPNVIWENNSSSYSSVGIGAGQQETDDYGRFALKMRAAIHLYDLTNTSLPEDASINSTMKTFVENNYQDIHLILWNYAFPFEQGNQDNLLYYSNLENVDATVANEIKTVYQNSMNSASNFEGLTNETDPYLAHLEDYVWGSNGIKSRKGLMFTNYALHNVNSSNNADAMRVAERYIHYLHGVNPLNFCYLSNMYDYGADHGVNEFYHTWFGDGTDWDNVLNDPYGPAPGFLTGGPNPSYNWDGCCPSGCSGLTCDATQVARIQGQPKQKAYDDFNTSWPMNSWEVTENSNGYQVAYIRLLSHFVSGSSSLSVKDNVFNDVSFSPNPFTDSLTVQASKPFNYIIYDLKGVAIEKGHCDQNCSIGKTIKTSGVYLAKLFNNQSSKTIKLIKK